MTTATRESRRILTAGMAFALLFAVLAKADGISMLESCKRSNRDIVISYVSGALERADLDVDKIVTALEGALERADPEKVGLKKAWIEVRKYCSPGVSVVRVFGTTGGVS